MEERTFDTLEEAQNFLKTRELSGPEAFGRGIGMLEPVPGASEQSQLALGPGSLIGSAVLGLLGFKPPVTKVIGSIASPVTNAIGSAASKVGSSARGLLTQTGTQAARVANVAGFLGREAAPEVRLAAGQSAIKNAFKVAENVEGKVPTGGIRQAIDKALTEGNIGKEAEQQLSLLKSSDTIGNTPLAEYRDIVDAAQNKLTSQGLPPGDAAKIRSVREALIDASRPVNPALANANAITAHFHSSEELINAVVGKNSRTASNAVDRILSKWGQNEPFRIASVGLDDPQKMAQFRSMVASGAGAEKLQAFLRVSGRASLYAGAGAAGYGAIHYFFPRSTGVGGGY